ncbi:MAG: hypothetical protein CMI29_04870 [Opitutae bacterium]|nr:hypothetical protein [Opitutae bacterium]|tara:strand:- start:3553 stop:3741 length:189 start_codon:yes stop_codon:yes gene_type:complete
MSITMFVTGFVIFCIYMGMLIWNIYNGHKITEKKSPYSESQTDEIDMDGMGDFSRFPFKKED